MMIFEVEWTLQALEDLRSYIRYISAHSGPRTAEKFFHDIKKEVQKLSLIAGMTQKREIIVKGHYKAKYYLHDNKVYITSFFSTRMNRP